MKDTLLLVFGVFAALWIFTRGTYMKNDRYNGTMGKFMSDFEEPECGLSKIKAMETGSRIVGGEDATYGEFPFMVSVRLVGDEFGEHQCGGSIIRKLWVLTAAHCVVRNSAEQVTVRVGEHNLTSQDDFEVDYPVVQIVLHPDMYIPKRHNNDIALLKLAKPVKYNDYVIPTCLPKVNEDFTGLTAVIMGWGYRNESKCQYLYDEAKKNATFHRGQICAGYRDGSKDSCQGDSGGPLTIKTGDSYIVIGVVSAGIGCGRPLLPGIYTAVADKMDWIEENIDAKGV